MLLTFLAATLDEPMTLSFLSKTKMPSESSLFLISITLHVLAVAALDKAVIRLENIVMCKIAHLCTVLCAILTPVRDFYWLMNYKTIDAKIAHYQLKLCAIFGTNVLNRAALTLSLIKVTAL